MAARVPVGVRELVDLAKVGEFTLPTELDETYTAILRVSEPVIEPPNVLDINQAAERIIAAARRGESADLFAVGREIDIGNRDRTAVDQGSLPRVRHSSSLPMS
jgi:hypothetical protein